ncbi:hypothetical protein M011DRAFT_64754 [Sporormia fimetaria CBS 119925]|uniref:Involucrin repeat protein n=1 Tax=Sporormia fimetaria CBS 119925 TaxID=1340428 RepID=A0A6A6VC53_9PLEO|nr:hypothetical protein M011DRAFT_64754 [Sporormia fimetaria CBS 119925]
MWSRITGKSESSSKEKDKDENRRPHSSSTRSKRAESLVSYSSSRKPSRSGTYPPPAPSSVASTYATARDGSSEYARSSAPTDRDRDRHSRTSRTSYDDTYDDKRASRSSRRRDKKERSRSRDRDSKRQSSTTIGGGYRGEIVDEPKLIERSFSDQIHTEGFSQFPGQPVASSMSTPLPVHSAPPAIDSHIASQFPGQTPTNFSQPFTPGLVHTNSFGAAADFYGDQGQSVLDQPGVRPGRPSVIMPLDTPHLTSASADFIPAQDTGTGTAADFYEGTQATASPSHPSQPSSGTAPPKPLRPSASTPHSPGIFGTAAAAGGAAALGYMAGHQAGTHQYAQSPSAPYHEHMAPLLGAGPSHNHPYTDDNPPPKPPRPGTLEHQSSASSHAGLYAAGAAGLAGAALHHHNSNLHPSMPGAFPEGPTSARTTPVPFQSGQMAQMMHPAEQKDAVSKVIDWWKDLEDVRKMEEYTEYIGVCRGCFDPRSSAMDAPRKHNYRRKRSGELRPSGIEKQSRYGLSEKPSRQSLSSDDGRRRSGNKSSWLAAGLGGAGLAAAGKALWNRRNDFDDTYSVKSGHERRTHTSGRSRSRSRERKRYSSGRSEASRRSRSSDRMSSLSTGVIRDAKKHKVRKSRSHSSSSSSSDGRAGLLSAAVGAGLAASVISASKKKHRQRSRSNSPRKSSVYHRRDSSDHDRRHSDHRRKLEHKSSRSSVASSAYIDISKSDRPQSGFLGGFFSNPPPKEKRRKSHSHSHAKKKKGFFNFGNASSSSSDSSLAFGAGYVKTRKRPARKTSDEKLKATLIGLGATATAIANHKSSGRPEVFAVRENRHKRHSKPRKSSKHEDDGWESMSEDDSSSSSAISGLAYGSYDWKKGKSQESLASSASGTSKWGWRWGSKKPKKRPSSESIHNPATGSSYIAPTIAGAAAGAAIGSAIGRQDSSTSSVHTLQSVYPVQTDANTFDARRTSSVATSQPYVTARPDTVPLQQPQPQPHIPGAIYATEAPFLPSYVAPTGPPVFSATHGPSHSYNSPQQPLFSNAPNEYSAPPLPRRSNSSPVQPSWRRDAAIATGSAVLGAAAASAYKNKHRQSIGSPSNVRFSLTDEQLRREERDERKAKDAQDTESRRRYEREQRQEASRHGEEERRQRELERREEQRRAEQEAERRREQERRDEETRRAELDRRREQERRDEEYRRSQAEHQARLEAEERIRRGRERHEEEARIHEAERQARIEVEQREADRRREHAERLARDAREEKERRDREARAEAQLQQNLERDLEQMRKEQREAERREAEIQEDLERRRRHQSDSRSERVFDPSELQQQQTGSSVASDVRRKELELQERERAIVSPSVSAGSVGAASAAVAAAAIASAAIRDTPSHREITPIVKSIEPSKVAQDYVDEEIFDPNLFRKPKKSAAYQVLQDWEDRYTAAPVSQADFFAPKELLEDSSKFPKVEKVDPNAGVPDIHVYQAHGDPIVSPPREPPYPPTYSLVRTKDGYQSAPPYPVPTLNLIQATPPGSKANSVRGVSVPPSPVMEPVKEEQNEAKRDEDTTRGSRVSWGENKIHDYEVPTPETHREQFISDDASRGYGAQGYDEIVVEDESSNRTSYHVDDAAAGAKVPEIPPSTQYVPDQDETSWSGMMSKKTSKKEKKKAEAAAAVALAAAAAASSIDDDDLVSTVSTRTDPFSDKHAAASTISEPLGNESVISYRTDPFSDRHAASSVVSSRTDPFSDKHRAANSIVSANDDLYDLPSSDISMRPSLPRVETMESEVSEDGSLVHMPGAFEDEAPEESASGTSSRKSKKKKKRKTKSETEDVAPPQIIDEAEPKTTGPAAYEEPEQVAPESEPADELVRKLSKKERKKAKAAKWASLGTLDDTDSSNARDLVEPESTGRSSSAGGLAALLGSAMLANRERDAQLIDSEPVALRTETAESTANVNGSRKEEDAASSAIASNVPEPIDGTPRRKEKRRSGMWEPSVSSPLREVHYNDYIDPAEARVVQQPRDQEVSTKDSDAANTQYQPIPMEPEDPRDYSTHDSGHFAPGDREPSPPAEVDSGEEFFSAGSDERKSTKARSLRPGTSETSEVRSTVTSPQDNDDIERSERRRRRREREADRSPDRSYAFEEPGERKRRHRRRTTDEREDDWDDRSVISEARSEANGERRRTRSSAASDPGDGQDRERKSSRRKSRHEDDEEYDLKKSPSSRHEEDRSSKAKEKEKRSSGIFSLFGRSKESPPPSPRSPKSPKYEEDEERRHRRKKHRDRGSTYGSDDDDARSVTSSSSRREKRRSHGKGDDHINEDQSFLGDRAVAATPLPVSEASPVIDTKSPSSLQDSGIPTESHGKFPDDTHDSFPPPTVAETIERPTTPVEDSRALLARLTGLEPGLLAAFPDELPPLPPSLPSSPSKGTPEHLRSPLSIRSRRTLASPSAQDLTLDLQRALSPPKSPSRHRKTPSTEFTNTREYRPLYLVERNRKSAVDEVADEALPELPGSGPGSGSASVVEGEEERDTERETEDEYQSALESPHLSTTGSLEVLESESQQTTPKASMFPVEVREWEEQGVGREPVADFATEKLAFGDLITAPSDSAKNDVDGAAHQTVPFLAASPILDEADSRLADTSVEEGRGSPSRSSVLRDIALGAAIGGAAAAVLNDKEVHHDNDTSKSDEAPDRTISPVEESKKAEEESKAEDTDIAADAMSAVLAEEQQPVLEKDGSLGPPLEEPVIVSEQMAKDVVEPEAVVETVTQDLESLTGSRKSMNKKKKGKSKKGSASAAVEPPAAIPEEPLAGPVTEQAARPVEEPVEEHLEPIAGSSQPILQFVENEDDWVKNRAESTITDDATLVGEPSGQLEEAPEKVRKELQRQKVLAATQPPGNDEIVVQRLQLDDQRVSLEKLLPDVLPKAAQEKKPMPATEGAEDNEGRERETAVTTEADTTVPVPVLSQPESEVNPKAKKGKKKKGKRGIQQQLEAQSEIPNEGPSISEDTTASGDAILEPVALEVEQQILQPAFADAGEVAKYLEPELPLPSVEAHEEASPIDASVPAPVDAPVDVMQYLVDENTGQETSPSASMEREDTPVTEAVVSQEAAVSKPDEAASPVDVMQYLVPEPASRPASPVVQEVEANAETPQPHEVITEDVGEEQQPETEQQVPTPEPAISRDTPIAPEKQIESPEPEPAVASSWGSSLLGAFGWGRRKAQPKPERVAQEKEAVSAVPEAEEKDVQTEAATSTDHQAQLPIEVQLEAMHHLDEVDIGVEGDGVEDTIGSIALASPGVVSAGDLVQEMTDPIDQEPVVEPKASVGVQEAADTGSAALATEQPLSEDEKVPSSPEHDKRTIGVSSVAAEPTYNADDTDRNFVNDVATSRPRENEASSAPENAMEVVSGQAEAIDNHAQIAEPSVEVTELPESGITDTTDPSSDTIERLAQDEPQSTLQEPLVEPEILLPTHLLSAEPEVGEGAHESDDGDSANMEKIIELPKEQIEQTDFAAPSSKKSKKKKKRGKKTQDVEKEEEVQDEATGKVEEEATTVNEGAADMPMAEDAGNAILDLQQRSTPEPMEMRESEPRDDELIRASQVALPESLDDDPLEEVQVLPQDSTKEKALSETPGALMTSTLAMSLPVPLATLQAEDTLTAPETSRTIEEDLAPAVSEEIASTDVESSSTSPSHDVAGVPSAIVEEPESIPADKIPAESQDTSLETAAQDLPETPVALSKKEKKKLKKAKKTALADTKTPSVPGTPVEEPKEPPLNTAPAVPDAVDEQTEKLSVAVDTEGSGHVDPPTEAESATPREIDNQAEVSEAPVTLSKKEKKKLKKNRKASLADTEISSVPITPLDERKEAPLSVEGDEQNVISSKVLVTEDAASRDASAHESDPALTASAPVGEPAAAESSTLSEELPETAKSLETEEAPGLPCADSQEHITESVETTPSDDVPLSKKAKKKAKKGKKASLADSAVLAPASASAEGDVVEGLDTREIVPQADVALSVEPDIDAQPVESVEPSESVVSVAPIDDVQKVETVESNVDTQPLEVLELTEPTPSVDPAQFDFLVEEVQQPPQAIDDASGDAPRLSKNDRKKAKKAKKASLVTEASTEPSTPTDETKSLEPDQKPSLPADATSEALEPVPEGAGVVPTSDVEIVGEVIAPTVTVESTEQQKTTRVTDLVQDNVEVTPASTTDTGNKADIDSALPLQSVDPSTEVIDTAEQPTATLDNDAQASIQDPVVDEVAAAGSSKKKKKKKKDKKRQSVLDDYVPPSPATETELDIPLVATPTEEPASQNVADAEVLDEITATVPRTDIALSETPAEVVVAESSAVSTEVQEHATQDDINIPDTDEQVQGSETGATRDPLTGVEKEADPHGLQTTEPEPSEQQEANLSSVGIEELQQAGSPVNTPASTSEPVEQEIVTLSGRKKKNKKKKKQAIIAEPTPQDETPAPAPQNPGDEAVSLDPVSVPLPGTPADEMLNSLPTVPETPFGPLTIALHVTPAEEASLRVPILPSVADAEDLPVTPAEEPSLGPPEEPLEANTADAVVTSSKKKKKGKKGKRQSVVEEPIVNTEEPVSTASPIETSAPEPASTFASGFVAEEASPEPETQDAEEPSGEPLYAVSEPANDKLDVESSSAPEALEDTVQEKEDVQIAVDPEVMPNVLDVPSLEQQVEEVTPSDSVATLKDEVEQSDNATPVEPIVAKTVSEETPLEPPTSTDDAPFLPMSKKERKKAKKAKNKQSGTSTPMQELPSVVMEPVQDVEVIVETSDLVSSLFPPVDAPAADEPVAVTETLGPMVIETARAIEVDPTHDDTQAEPDSIETPSETPLATPVEEAAEATDALPAPLSKKAKKKAKKAKSKQSGTATPVSESVPTLEDNTAEASTPAETTAEEPQTKEPENMPAIDAQQTSEPFPTTANPDSSDNPAASPDHTPLDAEAEIAAREAQPSPQFEIE